MAQPRFSQQIPKVICERSCRKAKTLCLTIPQNLKKESEKRKKIKKKILFFRKNVKNAYKTAFPGNISKNGDVSSTGCHPV
jgi:hypothetical protein